MSLQFLIALKLVSVVSCSSSSLVPSFPSYPGTSLRNIRSPSSASSSESLSHNIHLPTDQVAKASRCCSAVLARFRQRPHITTFHGGSWALSSSITSDDGISHGGRSTTVRGPEMKLFLRRLTLVRYSLRWARCRLRHCRHLDFLLVSAASTTFRRALMAFCSLEFPLDGTIGSDSIQVWWGNTVYLATLDAAGAVLRTVSPAQPTFG